MVVATYAGSLAMKMFLDHEDMVPGVLNVWQQLSTGELVASLIISTSEQGTTWLRCSKGQATIHVKGSGGPAIGTYFLFP
jgi:hypothetical protein